MVSLLLWFFVPHCFFNGFRWYGSRFLSAFTLRSRHGPRLDTTGLSGIGFFNRGRPLQPCLSSGTIGSPFGYGYQFHGSTSFEQGAGSAFFCKNYQ